MKISASQIYSGQNINAYKQRKSHSEKEEKAYEETKQSTLPIVSKDLEAYKLNENNNTFIKERVTYSNQQALSEYINLHNLEKREYAQAALGFSLYA